MAKSANGVKARKILLGYEPLSRFGACWYYVWKAYEEAGAQNDLGGTRTAYQAAMQSLGKHYDRNPPDGAAIWLGKRLSDGNMDGDVIIAGPRDGKHVATDQPTWGKTGVTSIEARMRLTGREYLFWTDHVGNAPIIMGTESRPKPINVKDDDMAILIVTRNDPNKAKGLYDPDKKGIVREISVEESEFLRSIEARSKGAAACFGTVRDATYAKLLRAGAGN